MPAVAEPVLAMRDALWSPHRAVPLAEAAGCIAAEALTPYPPGIPVVLPGERLRAEVLERVAAWVERGGAMRALADPTAATIRVVDAPRSAPRLPSAPRDDDRASAALAAACQVGAP